MDVDEYRAASLSQWERSAEGWGRRREDLDPFTSVVSTWMVDAIAPQPGQVILELAAGPGDTGLRAAERLGPDGRLICSDFAEPMLEVARRRAAEVGADNVEFRVLNAESLDLDAASVDGVLCRWGYMLMADPAAALQETRRVLRPGGRLALAAWDEAQANPWVSILAARVRELLGAPPPDPDMPNMFAFARPGRLQGLLEDAGFGDIVVEPLPFEIAYESADHWWEVQLDLGRPLADMVGQLSDEQRQRLRETVEADGAAFADDGGGLRFPARTLVAAASA